MKNLKKFLMNDPMKKYLCLTLSFLIISCSESSKFKIEGIVSNAEHSKIFLDEQGVEAIKPVDSVKIRKNGSFRFIVENDYPKFYNLHLEDNKILPLLISPGEKLFIQTKSESFNQDYNVEGSEGSQQIKMLNDTLFYTRKKLDSIRIIYNDPSVTKEKHNELAAEYARIVENQRKFTLQFVLDHLTSMASIYALYQKLDDETFVLYKNKDIQILKITGRTLDTIYPESPHVRALVANAASLEEQVYSSELRNLMQYADSEFPEIALPDPEGDTIRLSSLKGKVILLSFWASWDKNSTYLNPYLIELYNRYNSSGFEIYQVSLDNRMESWVQAIEYEELPWINVSDLSYPESVIAGNYNIQSLPANYLISRSGVIVGKNLSISDLNSRIPDLISE
jgi:thiol-disulfide isomerase/thioredoxin